MNLFGAFHRLRAACEVTSVRSSLRPDLALRHSFQSTNAVALEVRSTIANRVPTLDMERIWPSAERLLPNRPPPGEEERDANGTGVWVAVAVRLRTAARRVLATYPSPHLPL